METHLPDGAAPASGELQQRPDVSVIAPVYRNRETLMALSERVAEAFNGGDITWELILVIDSCPERSEEALRECIRRYPAVRGLYLPENQGQNRAVLWGLTRARGHRVAVLDADLQDPPEALPRMLAALDETGAQLVFARRGGKWTSTGRCWTSRLFKAILWGRSGGRLPIDAGLFLVCERSVVEFLLESPFVAPYLMARLARFRGKVTAVRVARSPRLRGTSAYSSGMRLRLALLGLLQLFHHPSAPSSGRARQPWRGRLVPVDQLPLEAGNVSSSRGLSPVGPGPDSSRFRS